MDKMSSKLSFDFKTNQAILQLISYLDSFNGKWKLLESKENRLLKDLRYNAGIASTGGAMRVENGVMTDEEIKDFLATLKNNKPKTKEEQEVAGYYELLKDILANYATVDLNENYIKQLHRDLVYTGEKIISQRGHYKTVSNKVIATYADGSRRIIFNTTDPHLVAPEMQELLRWTLQEQGKDELHPLMVTGAFIYEFLSIQPFNDANQRVSKLLTTFLLLKTGYSFMQYLSLESLLEKQKAQYYDALMQGQRNRYSENERMDKWLLFFLESLKTLVDELDEKCAALRVKATYLNPRQKKVREYISQHQPVKLGDLAGAFPETSINTLKKDLIYLRAEKIIEPLGRGKGTIYILKEE